MIKFMDLQSQHTAIREELNQAIKNIIDRSAFIGGETVSDFERQFASYLGAEFCVGVGNGTDALEIALEAADLPRGSEVIVPANSFIATGEAVTRAGLKVVFADVEDYYNISPETIGKVVSQNTSAIIPVHLYGHPCDMAGIMDVAQQKGLRVIEDCAQAHGAKYLGKTVGTFGDFAAFSFYPGKNLGAFGDAGAVVCQSEKNAQQVRKIANHGRLAKYDHEFEGRNSRLDAIQAAVLSVKLKHLDEWTDHRKRVAEWYRENLCGVDQIKLPPRLSFADHVYHLFVIRAEKRDELKAYLENAGIMTGIHYPIALPKLMAYEYLHADIDSTFYGSVDKKLLSLPMGDHLTEEQCRYIATTIRKFFK